LQQEHQQTSERETLCICKAAVTVTPAR